MLKAYLAVAGILLVVALFWFTLAVAEDSMYSTGQDSPDWPFAVIEGAAIELLPFLGVLGCIALVLADRLESRSQD